MVYPTRMPNINYRELSEIDAEAISEIRSSVLKSDPDTFSISIEEENRGSIETLKNVLATYHSAHDRAVFGAFDNTLIGMIGVERFQGDYTKHKARIWGLCVVQSHRKQGVATALITQSIELAERLNGVEKMVLDVTGVAADALQLYKRFGFSIIGTEINALKVEHGYIDNHHMELCLRSEPEADTV